MLGKTVVEAALLDHLDRSLVDHFDGALLDHPDGSLVNTVRRRATVLGRPQGDRLLQNNSEYSTAIKPVSSRMMPRVLTLMLGVVASTAKARMAPSTIRKMPTPMLIFHRPSRR